MPKLAEEMVARGKAFLLLAGCTFGIFHASATASVLGEDNRVAVLDTTQYPSRAIVQILKTDNAGSTSLCTGALISRNLVLTAASCLHSGTKQGVLFSNFKIVAGRNVGAAPFGTCSAQAARLLEGWVNADSIFEAKGHDIGALVLDCNIGERTGWFGLHDGNPPMKGQPTELLGYAADKAPVGRQWLSKGSIQELEESTLFYDNDTFGGTSGAPVTLADAPDRIVAVHSRGLHGEGLSGTYNSGDVIDARRVSTIQGWIEEADDPDLQVVGREHGPPEKELWASVKDSWSLGELDAFLDLFPEGEFAEEARQRRDRIRSDIAFRNKVRDSNIETLASLPENSALKLAGKPVGRLIVGFAETRETVRCTAFLLGDGLALTANDCLAGIGGLRPNKVSLTMGVQASFGQEDSQTYDVQIEPVESSSALNYAVVKVHGQPSGRWGALKLQSGPGRFGDQMFMIHFPGPLEQHVTIGKCRDSEFVPFDHEMSHGCDALVGALGAPVFRFPDKSVAVALHTRGFEPSDASNRANTATYIAAIVRHSTILKKYSVPSSQDGNKDASRNSGELAAELAAWKIIQSSDDLTLFASFLEHYPNGQMAQSAARRLSELAQATQARNERRESVGLEVSANERPSRSKTTVYLECQQPDSPAIVSGTGVIVSEKGHILTARHVAPDNSYECWGSIGSAARRADRRLRMGRFSQFYDARILRLVPDEGETFQYLRLAELTQEMQLKDITAYGFPVGGTGQIDARFGKITTTIENDDGTINTDGLTARGMSGGPVVLGTDGDLIGIVAGASIDNLYSIPDAFKVLSVGFVMHEFGVGQKN